MIGERLAEIRKDHGDTQVSLAEKLKVSLPAVRAWEQGKSDPGHDLLVSICKLYDVSADYLLGLSNEDPVFSPYRPPLLFNREELQALKDYEAFLLWKRKKK